MKQYSFLNENIGRQLIGASKFSSKSKVVKQIINTYPEPQSLANALNEMSMKCENEKLSQKIHDLALKCSALQQGDYYNFVKSLVSMNALWKILAISAGTAGIGALGYWLVNSINRSADNVANQSNTNRNDIIKQAVNNPNVRNSILTGTRGYMKSDIANAAGKSLNPVLHGIGNLQKSSYDDRNSNFLQRVSGNLKLAKTTLM